MTNVSALSGSASPGVGASGVQQVTNLVASTVAPTEGVSSRTVKFNYTNGDGDSVLAEFTVTKQSGPVDEDSLWPFTGVSNFAISVEGEEV